MLRTCHENKDLIQKKLTYDQIIERLAHPQNATIETYDAGWTSLVDQGKWHDDVSGCKWLPLTLREL